MALYPGTNLTFDEWDEYCAMPQIQDNETPSEWKERIWPRLQYFRDNNILPESGKKYLKGRKIIYSWDNSTDSIENGIAICLSCDQLVYIGKNINTGNYYHSGIEKHWRNSCSGNKFCGLDYSKYLETIQKPKSTRSINEKHALYLYRLWQCNAIRKIRYAKKIGKKIWACIIIQRKILEWLYHPKNKLAKKLELHYKYLQNIREKFRINNL